MLHRTHVPRRTYLHFVQEAANERPVGAGQAEVREAQGAQALEDGNGAPERGGDRQVFA